MKKTLLLVPVLFLAVFISCGKAAEDREAMHIRAKSFQDSIANVIRTTLAEAEGPSAATLTPSGPEKGQATVEPIGK